MRPRDLVARGLSYYRGTHAAVVVGVAVAVSVLAGALVVGESVRASLRELLLGRLGRTDHAVTSSGFFREGLAAELASSPGFAGRFRDAAPLIALEGVVTHEASGRRASRVQVYGVDRRFWEFHGRDEARGPDGREALASEGLARELGSAPADTLLARVPRPSDVPASTLFGRKDDLGRTVRVNLASVLAAADLGEFSLRPQQQEVHALFVPLALLQRSLDRAGEVDTVLLAEAQGPGAPPEHASAAARLLARAATLADRGLRLREVDGGYSLESDQAILGDRLVRTAGGAAQQAGYRPAPVLTYLASSIRSGGREVPYSLVAAVDPESFATLVPDAPAREGRVIALNEWAARDLGVRAGDAITLDYHVWDEQGRLETRSTELRLAAVVPIAGLAADRDLAPEYPGITGSEQLSDWDPPFPIDLSRIRPRDEEYWERYRTTPKAFVPLEVGQELWRHRLGAVTSLRLAAGGGGRGSREDLERALTSALDPLDMGFAVTPVREAGLRASRGATDFGEYFLYFSAFLVGSALLLSGLFFRLGVEQRLREVGLLRAVGFPRGRLVRLYLAEGALVSVLGGLLGVAGAWGYAAAMVLGLRTLWVDAVGTRDLAVHVSAVSLLAGVAGGIAAGVLSIAWTLRGLGRVPPRRLLAGARDDAASARGHGTWAARLGVAAFVLSVALAVSATTGFVGSTAGFFGAGSLLLAGALLLDWRLLAGGGAGSVTGRGAAGLARLGFRGASHRPGRSVLIVALIAFASFVIVAVSVFRRDGEGEWRDRASGTGGYALIAESLLPLHHDPAAAEGRDALGIGPSDAPELVDVGFDRFRLRAGEDASCLNLYRPGDPRILGATPDFVRQGRFAFQGSLAAAPEDRANPWRLLESGPADGAIPAIADANSMSYVLHRKLGEHVVVSGPGGEQVRLRLVGALKDSLFQSELIVSEAQFLRLFGDEAGYRVFLVDAPGESLEAVSEALESRLSDTGLDAVPTAARLASFHRVENAYLSTFQTLGALGLVLGTVGLGTVLVRNALERRRELALLRAVGYRPGHLSLVVTAENALLLTLGLASGTAAALLAVAPAALERGGRLPWTTLAALLAAVLLTGLLVSGAAVAAVRRAPLLAALREE